MTAEEYCKSLGVEPNFWKFKNLDEFNENEWESICCGCGKCCLCKIVFKKKFYPTNVVCKHLNLKNGLCKIYNKRFKKTDECEKVSLDDLKQQKESYFFGCSYYLLYNGYDLPDWHPLKTGDPNSTYTSGNSILNYKLISEKDIKQEDLDNYIISWDSIDSYVKIGNTLYCKASRLK